MHIYHTTASGSLCASAPDFLELQQAIYMFAQYNRPLSFGCCNVEQFGVTKYLAYDCVSHFLGDNSLYINHQCIEACPLMCMYVVEVTSEYSKQAKF